jgi:small subunit ribosomal protein S29
MVQNLRKANAEIFNELKTVQPHPNLLQHCPVGSTLSTLANIPKDGDSAWAVLNALWQELTIKGEGRPPILFTLDGLAHIMKYSAYRTAAFDLVHAHDLALVRRFVDLLAGISNPSTVLPNGGAIIAATSSSNSPVTPSMDLALGQRAAEADTSLSPPKRDPYFRDYDARVDAALQTVRVLSLRSINKTEARALLEYWAASGMLRETVNELTVTDKWSMGGNGIVGEIEKAALLTMRY